MTRPDPAGRSLPGWAYDIARSIYCWVALALLTSACVAVYLPVAAVSPESAWARDIERFWVWVILRASNVRLTVRGLENVHRGQSYIVMANHRSMYDIPVLHHLLSRDRDLRWIAKKELLAVPVFGWAYRVSRHIPVDRQHRQRAIDALKRAAAASAEGVSFVIMPEGTRSVDGKLLSFKKGGFHLAIDTGLPILPVGVSGSERLMRKGSWLIVHGAIDVVVRPPVPVAGLGKESVEALRDRVRAEIEAALDEVA